MSKLPKSPCPRCGKEITDENMTRHIFDIHISSKKSGKSEKGLLAIKNGLKNTTPCINYQRTRSTLISLDGMPFRPFSRVKLSDMTKATEIRACGKEFSLYQEKRTWINRHKIHWVDEEEHGNPTYVPNNMLDRAIAAGIDV
jgi:hypothetical protein